MNMVEGPFIDQFEQLKAIQLVMGRPDKIQELRAHELRRLAHYDRENINELKGYLDQVDVIIPEALVKGQAEECITYKIVQTIRNDSAAVHGLKSGILEAYTEQE